MFKRVPSDEILELYQKDQKAGVKALMRQVSDQPNKTTHRNVPGRENSAWENQSSKLRKLPEISGQYFFEVSNLSINFPQCI